MLTTSDNELSLGLDADMGLSADPQYQELLVLYQRADWNHCRQILAALLLKYPEHPRLVEFKADIEMHLMLRHVGQKNLGDHVKRGVKPFLVILSLVLIVLGLGGVFLYQLANNYVLNLEASRSQALAAKSDSLKSLEEQARVSLSAGQPDKVLDLIVKMEAIDPNYAAIADLRSQNTELMMLVKLYDQGMQNMQEEKYPEAREIFNQILAKDAAFRDVRYQISVIDGKNKVSDLLGKAEGSYRKGAWLEAIASFEEVFALDSSVETPETKDELLYSYLKSIVETLSQADPTIPELERSGSFYQKAISLIPQNRNYLAARENLQQLSLELLVTKYFQIAKGILRDPEQSEAAVNQAVDFLNKSLSLKADNSAVKIELDKATVYQKALLQFNGSNWEAAIKTLTDLIKFDQEYPNGMGKVLLYESYALLGDRFFARGLYMDARANYEQAEILAWDQTDNKMRLFQVQISLGYTFGKLENFKDAVSYFEFALKANGALEALKEDQNFVSLIQQGRDLNQQGKYADAYQNYVEAMNKVAGLYKFSEVQAASGTSLVSLANANHTTVRAIRDYNQVEFPVVTSPMALKIPALP